MNQRQPGSDPSRQRSGNPAVRAGAVPPRSPARAEVERRSRPLLVRLAKIPRWVVLVLVLVLAVAGLMLPGVAGAVILLLLAALVAWLVTLSWPALQPAARAARILLVALMVGYAVWKVVAGP